ncbi:MAG: Endonuclease/exonuclease/phosphatase [Gemmatimonadetes bacterium]|nr:Endonuclease/exonuclease/phosphatase [Gemmatimonadota bacterium]
MKSPMLTTAFLAMLVAACSEGLTAPSDPALADAGGRPGTPIVVMTRNMYVGADVDRVIAALAGASGEDPADALAAAINQLYVTDLPTRVGALADDIARHRPAAVALQEVSTISIPMITYGADFLTALQQALVARGLSYHPYSNLNFDFQNIAGMGIRLADADVLLIDSRVDVLQATHGTFTCPGLCLPSLPGIGDLTRGWVRVDARVAGKPVTFVGTHPESGADPQLAQLRAGQMQELLGTLPAGNPVILMGDLNDVPGSMMHQVLTGPGGFHDVWAEVRPGEDGFTCCYDSDLLGGSLVKRIDYVMVRGGFLDGTDRLVGGTRIGLVGDAASDRVTGPFGAIWPSDHAGVVVSLPPTR